MQAIDCNLSAQAWAVALPRRSAGAGEAGVRERAALIVHPDPATRRLLHTRLLREGYDTVISCLGPGMTPCPALAGPAGLPCARVLAHVDRVLLAASLPPELAAFYREWLPDAEVVIHPAPN